MEKYQMEKSEEEKATYFVDEETLTKEELDQVFDGKGAEQYHEDAGVQTKSCGCVCKKSDGNAKDMEAELAGSFPRAAERSHKAEI